MTQFPLSDPFLKLVMVERVVSVLADELDEVLQLSALLVLDRVALVVALEEVDGGEALDRQALHFHFVRRVVHLGDYYILIVRELVTQLIPDGGWKQNGE